MDADPSRVTVMPALRAALDVALRARADVGPQPVGVVEVDDAGAVVLQGRSGASPRPAAR